MTELLLNVDGAYRGKYGGVASYGYIVKKNSKTIRKDYGLFLEERVTSNYAEYMALIKALRWIKDSEQDIQSISIRSDSQLVVNQVNGDWSVRSDNLKDLHKKARKLFEHFEEQGISVRLEHVLREKNIEADELSQLAIEDHLLARNIKKKEKICDVCGKKMVKRKGKYGKFWGCTGYPDCKNTEKHG